jgi:hypothetical protein
MALTKVNRGGLNTGISDSSDATFLTATSSEGVTLAGTLAVTGVHTVGNNAIHTSDGGAVTQNLVQGLLKAWVHAHQHARQDSFNIASETDTSTGDYTFTYTNNFSSDNYCAAASNQSTRNGQGLYVGNFATSTFRINPSNASGSSTDYDTTTLISGDLA